MGSIEGSTVVDVREMTDEEMNEMNWHGRAPMVLVLDNDFVLFPSRDPEMNDSGTWFGDNSDGLGNLEGERVDSILPMTEAFMESIGWQTAANVKPAVIVFEDDRAVYPSADPEGNAAGALLGFEPDGQLFDIAFGRADA